MPKEGIPHKKRQEITKMRKWEKEKPGEGDIEAYFAKTSTARRRPIIAYFVLALIAASISRYWELSSASTHKVKHFASFCTQKAIKRHSEIYSCFLFVLSSFLLSFLFFIVLS